VATAFTSATLPPTATVRRLPVPIERATDASATISEAI
jgi:hypothetical protein